MVLLTVAAKANGALVLPALLAVAYVKQTLPGIDITVAYEDVESVGSQGAKLELKTDDGKLIHDDDILPYLENTYEALQNGSKEQVRENHTVNAPGTTYLLMISVVSVFLGSGMGETIRCFQAIGFQIIGPAHEGTRFPPYPSVLHRWLLPYIGRPSRMGNTPRKQDRRIDC